MDGHGDDESDRVVHEVEDDGAVGQRAHGQPAQPSQHAEHEHCGFPASSVLTAHYGKPDDGGAFRGYFPCRNTRTDKLRTNCQYCCLQSSSGEEINIRKIMS